MNAKRKNNIVHAIEFAICLITVTAVMLAILSFVAMVEAMTISTTSACIFIASIAWIAVVGLYLYCINK